MQEDHNDDIGGVAALDVPVSSEAKVQGLDEAAAVSDCSNDASDIKIGTVEESHSHENEICLHHVTKTNDYNPLANSKTPASDAHELETDLSIEEIISCSNGIILDRKLVKCN